MCRKDGEKEMTTEEAITDRLYDYKHVEYVPYKSNWIEKMLLVGLIIQVMLAFMLFTWGSIPSKNARSNIEENQVIECQLLYSTSPGVTNPTCEELIADGNTIISSDGN